MCCLPTMVPPLAALASVAAQMVGLFAVRKAFDWRRVAPYLIGALVGVPLGVWLLSVASPGVLRLSVAGFLVTYALFHLGGPARMSVGNWGGRKADGVVGVGGGILGGFAGLSGPLPVIWLQLRGGPSDQQRATYQPFNLIVLSLASAGMAIGGHIDQGVLLVAGMCLPVTLFGAWIGTRAYLEPFPTKWNQFDGAYRLPGQARCAARCCRIGQASQRSRGADTPHRRPGSFTPWRRCASLPMRGIAMRSAPIHGVK